MTHTNPWFLGAVALGCFAFGTPVFADLSVGNYALQNVTRVSRYEFDYRYTATVTNTGGETAKGVTARVFSINPSLVIMDGEVTFGDVAGGATVTSSDAFTVRHDRRQGFDGDNLNWGVGEDNETSTGTHFTHPEKSYSLEIPFGLLQKYDRSSDTLFIRRSAYEDRISPFISISVLSNPKSLSVFEYFDGDPGTDLFGASANSYATTSVNEITSYVFIPYQTLAGDFFVVVPHRSIFIIVHDAGAAFQDDGTFREILNSLRTGG